VAENRDEEGCISLSHFSLKPPMVLVAKKRDRCVSLKQIIVVCTLEMHGVGEQMEPTFLFVW